MSSTRERMVELVKGALIDTDYKVGERERKWEGSEGTVDLVVERTLLQVSTIKVDGGIHELNTPLSIFECNAGPCYFC